MSGQIAFEYIDSLKQVLKTTDNDSTRARAYRLLENSTRAIDAEVSIKYLDSGLAIIKRLHWTRGLAIYYNDMGANYHDRSIFDKAVEYYHKSLEYSKDVPGARVSTYGNLATLYHHQNNDSLAYIYNEKMGEIAREENYQFELGNYYNYAAFIERDTLRKKQLFLESIGIYRQLDLPLSLATGYMNLGDITHDHGERLSNYYRAKTIFDSINPSYITATSNDIALGEEYLLLAQDEGVRKNAGITATKGALLDRAEAFIRESIDISKDYDYIQNLMFAYGKLAEIKKEKGEFEEALEYAELNYVMYDSIYSQENKNKLAKLESQKELELRDKEIEVNKLQLDSQKKQQLYLLGGMMSLAVIGGLLFYQSRTRRRTNRKLLQLNHELDESNKMKARFFGILNHDLRSPVSNLIHFLHLQKESPELLSEGTRARLEANTITAAENLLVSMEDILLWSKGQMENFRPRFEKIPIADLFGDISRHFSSEHHVAIRFENPQNLSIETDVNYLKTIMRNLTGNALKVLVHTEKPRITWNAGKEGTRVVLSITDNGPGGSDDTFKALYDDNEIVGIRTGLGLHLIRDLAKAISCEVTVWSEEGKGTVVTMRFP